MRSYPWNSRASWPGTAIFLSPPPGLIEKLRLVLLHRQDVIASPFDHLRTKIAMREHRVARDDLVLDRQHPQEFRSGLVLVGLGIDPELGQNRFDVRGGDGHQVDAGRAAVATPPGGLAVDGQVRGVVLPELRLNPPANTRLEVDDVDPAKDPRIGSLTETPLGGEPEKLQKPPAPLLAVLNDRLIAGHARKHAYDRQAEQCGERVPLTLGAARIVKALKKFHQRGAGVHARVLIRSPSDVIHHIRWI